MTYVFNHRGMRIPYQAFLLILLILFFSSSCKNRITDPLTLEERAWILNNETIRLGPDPSAPPLDFFDDDGNYVGLTADYIHLIEKKLGIQFQIVRMETWDKLLKSAEKKEIDIICAAKWTPERGKYLLFTKPFIHIPEVIIVRKDTSGISSIEDLLGKKVAMVEGYAVLEILKEKYPWLEIETKSNYTEVLTEISFNTNDATIVELTTASYVIRENGIENLKVAAYTDITLDLAIASRKDLPILNSILEKGLALISEKEKKEVFSKWISLDIKPFYLQKELWIILSGFVLFIILIIISSLLWNRSLKAQVLLRTAKLDESNKQLENSINRYRMLVENIPGTTYRCSNDEFWTMDYISKGIETLSGYNSGDFLNNKVRSYSSLIHREDRQSVHDKISRSLKDDKSCTIVHRIIRKNNEIRWILNKFQSVYDEKLQQLKLDGVIIDITERKMAKDNLHHLRYYLTSIFDSMPSALIGVNREGTVTQWNKSTEELTGIGLDAAMGYPLPEVFPSISSDMKIIRRSIESCKVEHVRKKLRIIDNSTIYVDITIYPLLEANMEDAVIRIDDITEKIRMEEMMIQSEKMLSVGGLAAGIAHEINNPLAGMVQTAAVLQHRLDNKVNMPANIKAAENAGTSVEAIKQFMEEREIMKMLSSIIESGGRAAEIVKNMLSFSRKNEGQKCSQDLAKLIDQTLMLASSDYNLKKQYDFKKIKIIREFDSNVPIASCESAKIQQVLLNLFKNGAQAMFEANILLPRFVIRLYMKKEDLRICLEIEDNGPGMEEDVRKRVFEPFFTTKDDNSGTGLGLSVSYFIITEIHQGEMLVESGPGLGSKFTIRLPVKL